MNPDRDPGRLRPLALAFVALIGMGAALLMLRPDSERVTAAKAPHRPVHRSSAPAAKEATHAAPAPVKAAPAVTVSRAAAATPRHSATVAPTHSVEVHAAARKTPKVGAETAPGEPPDINTPRIQTDTPPPPPEPLTITDTEIVATSSSSVQVAFKTSLPAQTRVSYGIGTPVIWSDASATDTVDHQVTI